MDQGRMATALAADLDGTFPDLVRAMQDGVYAGALRMLRNHADAEDVTQEAFIRAYRALAGYPAERIVAMRLRPWVWTIAANLARNRARSAGRAGHTVHEADVADSGPGPAEAAEAAAGLEDLAAALGELPWPMRVAVVLRHVGDLPYDEIAEAVDRPIGTVKSDVHRGLERLRSVIEPGGTP
jgi:RNA polymerase sigma-70 factor (ECF subfamily)